MTQAVHYLFTLAECCHRQPRTPAALAEAMKAAVDMVGNAPLSCILCGEALNGAPSYLSLVIPLEAGWTPLYGGLCLRCGATHDRPWLQRHVEARAHFALGEPVGHA